MEQELLTDLNSTTNPFIIEKKITEGKKRIGIDWFFNNFSSLNHVAKKVFLDSLSEKEIKQYLERILKMADQTETSLNNTYLLALMKAYSPKIVKKLLEYYRHASISMRAEIIRYLVSHKTRECANALIEIDFFEKEKIPRQILDAWKNSVIIAISALQEEMEALMDILSKNNIKNEEQTNGSIELWKLNNKKPSVILRLIGESGNIASRRITEDLLEKYNPYTIVLFGIAAAIPKRARTKDLIVTDKVWDLRKCKIGDKFEFEPKMFASVKSEMFPFQINEIKEKLKSELKEEIQVHQDLVMGSSDNLSRLAEYMSAASLTHRKLGGIEMESAGIAEICDMRQIPFCIIKSTTDYGDALKNDDNRIACCKIAATALSLSPFMKSLF
jgi:nucleoside phosphorylase